jgi:hypothetical protein
MAESTRSTHPPSEPRALPSRPAPTAADHMASLERPARLQMLAFLVLGLLLVAVPLYFWKRPRARLPDAAADTQVAAAQLEADAGPPSAAPSPSPSGVVLSSAKVLECHDPGLKRTSPEQCDRLAPFEEAFAHAIEQAAGCMPLSSLGGAIEYVADVSFGRKHNPIMVTMPKEGRSVRSLKAVTACGTGVRRALSSMSLESLAHAHSRYKIAMTATYPTPSK